VSIDNDEAVVVNASIASCIHHHVFSTDFQERIKLLFRKNTLLHFMDLLLQFLEKK
jgi:tmRNA-binding protein